MNAAAVIYVLIVASILCALAILLPRPDEWQYLPRGPHRRLGLPNLMNIGAAPENYWPPEQPEAEAPEHVGVTEDSAALTEEIERIEADPDTPAMLSHREEQAIEDAAYAAMFAECDEALAAAMTAWREAIEPARQTLSQWHREGRWCCQRCEASAARRLTDQIGDMRQRDVIQFS